MQSCPALCDPMDYTAHEILQASDTAVDSCSLLQGIFPTQESTQGLLRCGWILYQLSYQESMNIQIAIRVVFHRYINECLYPFLYCGFREAIASPIPIILSVCCSIL